MTCSLARALLLTGSIVASSACGPDEGSDAPAPAGAGMRDASARPPIVGGSGRDGETPVEDGGEPVSDGGRPPLANECETFDPVPFLGEDTPPDMLYNAVALPEDLAVTRAQVIWHASCVQPTILVTLSDGRCPLGDGHEIRFEIPADGIQTGTVALGQNEIRPEPSSSTIRVRYVRPDDLEPTGEWGSCAGATGNIDLIGELGTEAFAELQGDFTLELTRCDEGPESVQVVRGTFGVMLRRGLEDVCPSDG